MKNKVVKLFGGDDPRMGALAEEIKTLIYQRGIGVFQLSTILGILRIVEHEIIQEQE